MYLDCTVTSSTGRVIVICRQLHHCRTIGKHYKLPFHIQEWTVNPHIDILEFRATLPPKGSDK